MSHLLAGSAILGSGCFLVSFAAHPRASAASLLGDMCFSNWLALQILAVILLWSKR